MRITRLLPILFFLIISMSFSHAEEKNPEKPDVTPDTTEDIVRIAEPIIDDLSKALQDKDFELYKKHWAPGTAENITREEFDDACLIVDERYGKLLSRKFYDKKDLKECKILYWQTKFEKVPEEDMLYLKLIFKKIGSQYMVEGFFFKPNPGTEDE